ncbi:985967c5-8b54-4319-abb5-53b58a27a847-CDS [Sclerotinia trifoliorum]|uniref:985967c5-8b54-4319-abb5-53b58a27a847-CDS n=1 Tax=Sclerotinia trifoliorum TaxID=28548 RepID=A0A8H2VPF1_9HELO|nr:985967c5-8b54-4319-abb5-53b58a27a847-CDS [Sclerotinia trifoliorum]
MSGTTADHGFPLEKFVFTICNDSTPPPCYARQPMCLRSLVLTWEEGYSPIRSFAWRQTPES